MELVYASSVSVISLRAYFSPYIDSIDSGGPRGASQLKIIAEIMHRRNFGAENDEKKLPCDAFDMIGGVGSGG